MIVLKFGGTSVADARRIKEVANIVAGIHKKKKRVAVIFSAHGGVTDDLINVSRLAANCDIDYLEQFEKVKARHKKIIAELHLSKDRALANFLDASIIELHDLLHGVFLVRELSLRTLDFISGFGELLSTQIISSYFVSRKMPAFFLDAKQV